MKYLDAGADLSACGRYRYRLWRDWDRIAPRVVWVMLNPSTADASVDDPTIRKCVGFAKRWGFGGIEVVNLFAYRSTNPDVLVRACAIHGIDYVVGPENDAWIDGRIAHANEETGLVVAAWGANASRRPLRERSSIVKKRLAERVVHVPVVCLGRGGDGQPRHPLMLSYETPRIAL